MSTTLVVVVVAVFGMNFHLTRMARDELGRKRRRPAGKAARAGDALMIEAGAWVFAVLGLAIMCSSASDAATAAGGSFLIAAAILNVWAIYCVFMGAKRGERAQSLTHALLASMVMGIIVPLIMMANHFDVQTELAAIFEQRSQSCINYAPECDCDWDEDCEGCHSESLTLWH